MTNSVGISLPGSNLSRQSTTPRQQRPHAGSRCDPGVGRFSIACLFPFSAHIVKEVFFKHRLRSPLLNDPFDPFSDNVVKEPCIL